MTIKLRWASQGTWLTLGQATLLTCFWVAPAGTPALPAALHIRQYPGGRQAHRLHTVSKGKRLGEFDKRYVICNLIVVEVTVVNDTLDVSILATVQNVGAVADVEPLHIRDLCLPGKTKNSLDEWLCILMEKPLHYLVFGYLANELKDNTDMILLLIFGL